MGREVVQGADDQDHGQGQSVFPQKFPGSVVALLCGGGHGRILLVVGQGDVGLRFENILEFIGDYSSKICSGLICEPVSC